MNFLLENWFLIIVAIAVLTVSGYTLYCFIKMPKDNQLKQLREWLLYAVAKAERELGSGTGQLKLRYVYDMFILRFGALAKIISFEAFRLMVDEALDKFREMLANNTAVANYIEKV